MQNFGVEQRYRDTNQGQDCTAGLEGAIKGAGTPTELAWDHENGHLQVNLPLVQVEAVPTVDENTLSAEGVQQNSLA